MSKSGEEKRRMLSAGCQVVVGNLPYSMEPEPLYREFISCGDIVDVSVPKNKHGSCMGVAFIEFKDKVSVKAALAKAGATLQGREIRVTKAVKKVSYLLLS
ncbi:RNA recognition motif domain [Trinorchestia longiramus]|nr:RNA recognition motif domain [Trinorchestia longiramus]